MDEATADIIAKLEDVHANIASDDEALVLLSALALLRRYAREADSHALTPNVDSTLVAIASWRLGVDGTVDAIAYDVMREVNPSCPSLADGNTELYRSEARRAIVAALSTKEGGSR